MIMQYPFTLIHICQCHISDIYEKMYYDVNA